MCAAHIQLEYRVTGHYLEIQLCGLRENFVQFLQKRKIRTCNRKQPASFWNARLHVIILQYLRAGGARAADGRTLLNAPRGVELVATCRRDGNITRGQAMGTLRHISQEFGSQQGKAFTTSSRELSRT